MPFLLPCGTCPHLPPLSGIVPQCRAHWHHPQTLHSSGSRTAPRSHLTHSGNRNRWLKDTMRLRGKESCEGSLTSAADLGRGVASCTLGTCQLGLHSKRQESNPISLPKTLCVCESSTALDARRASLADKTTCRKPLDLPWGRTRTQWHSLGSSSGR